MDASWMPTSLRVDTDGKAERFVQSSAAMVAQANQLTNIALAVLG